MEEDTPEERQRNEIQALQAIYLEDFLPIHISLDEDERWKPPEFQLRLKPTSYRSEKDCHVHVDLHVKYSMDYPNTTPYITLENVKGFSAKEADNLKRQLIDLSTQKKGQEMVFDLAETIQKFLEERNHPQYTSFYDEMMSRQKHQLEQVQVAEKYQQDMFSKQEEQKILQIQEEIFKKQEKLRSELRKNKEYVASVDPWAHTNEKITEINRKNSQCDATVAPVNDQSCTHGLSDVVAFEGKEQRTFQRGSCLGVCSPQRAVFMGVDVVSGELGVITYYKLPPSDDVTAAKRQVSLVEHEFRSLQKLRHPNLVHYIGIAESHEKKASVLYIAQEYVAGCCAQTHIKQSIPSPPELVRLYALSLTQALAYLHTNNIIHRDLRDSCIYMDRKGIVRLADYSLETRISELFSVMKRELKLPIPPGRGGKKGDVFRMGVILLSLAKGDYVTGDNPRIPTFLAPSCRDFLFKCLIREERNRWSAEQLLGHHFLQEPLVKNPNFNKEQEQNEKSDAEKDELFVASISTVRTSKEDSRLQKEFEVLTFLGSGGFGDVLKVRNKLDGNLYAIKRVLLGNKSKQLNKKITREVKMLSRLNHENVVRYYNAWIEVLTDDEAKAARSQDETDSDATQLSVETTEIAAPPIEEHSTTSSWSSGSSSLSQYEFDESSDSDTSVNGWTVKPKAEDSSDGITFEASSQVSDAESEISKPLAAMKTPSRKTLQFLYIQMEYCEKSTLRSAIDSSELYKDKGRLWRLFREIVEGLVHIHQQGIIHRDLKPVNIFLDSRDHVKIGDFGLATSNVIAKPILSLVDDVDGLKTPKSVDTPEHGGTMSSDQLTGQVGTALYTAPELMTSGGKAVYDEKVDLYSLGIIFFEMSYPLSTGMERAQALMNARLQNIILPNNISDFMSHEQVQVIKWLLVHTPSARPTSLELLQSDYLPPPELEAAELQEMVRHTLNNPQSKAYKNLIASCFQQSTKTADEVVYDMGAGVMAFPSSRAILLQNSLLDVVRDVSARHGAFELNTPLLVPQDRSQRVEGVCSVMTKCGGVVSLPHNLHLPLARMVARNPLPSLKRFVIQKVYQERKMFGVHPKETLQCAIDIISSTSGTLYADAEIVVWAEEIVAECLGSGNTMVFYVNHALLLKSLLIHCGFPENKHTEILTVLKDYRGKRSDQLAVVQGKLIRMSLTKQAIDNLLSFMDLTGTLSYMTSHLRVVTNRKGEAASLAKLALHELEVFIGLAKALGLKAPVIISPAMLQNVQHYSGLFCQLACDMKRKKKKITEVLALAGRYDSMIIASRSPYNMPKPPVEGLPASGAVGATVFLDKVLLALLEDDVSDEIKLPLNSSLADVAVCAFGHRDMTRQKATLVKDLWSSGLRVTTNDHHNAQSLDAIQTWCREMGISHVVLLKDTENGTARLRVWDGERHVERKVGLAELADVIHRSLALSAGNRLPHSESADTSGAYYSHGQTRSDSMGRTLSISESSTNPTAPSLNYTFITEEKLAFNTRRRFENQIPNHLQPTLNLFSNRATLEIVGLELKSTVISALTACLKAEEESFKFAETFNKVVDEHRKHRKYLERVEEPLYRLRYVKKAPVLILYSLIDNGYKVII